MKIKTISLAICGLLFSFSATAKMYKWVDENGATQYSSTPPVGADVQVIKPPPKVDSESAQKQLNSLKELQKSDTEAQSAAKEEKIKADQVVKEKKKTCASAKKNLESYNVGQGSRLYKTESGEYIRYNQEQIDEKTKENQKIVRENCN